jgi:hypothetical protein
VDDFLQQLTEVNWSECFNTECVNTAWNAFQKIFLSVLDKVAPIKEVRIKQRTEEWMDSKILDLIRQRYHLLCCFNKSKKDDDYKNYCKARYIVQREIQRAKSEYFKDKIEENKKNPKKLWQCIKDLGLQNKKGEAKLCLKLENGICHNPLKIADSFVSFFLPM